MRKKVTFSMEIALDESKVRYLCDKINEPELTDGQKLAGLALGALQDLGEGGMVLNGNISRQITNVMGGVNDLQELVLAVERGHNMDAGRLVAKWYIDPTYVSVVEDIAKSQCMAPQDTMQSLMEYGVSQGWGYAMSPDTKVVFMSMKDYQWIEGLLSRTNLTGTDLVGVIKALVHGTEPQVSVELQGTV